MPASKPNAATPLQPRRRAIIIGSAKGLGAALARRLAREGYLLGLIDRNPELLQTTCSEINAAGEGTQALAYIHDVTAFDEIPALLQKIMLDLGGLDLFIYNAGILLPTTPTTYDFEKDLKMMQVNALGAQAWFNAVAPIFQSLNSGQIVGISSVAADRGRVGNPGYNASKAALATYLEALRNRLSRHGVHVLTVKPGFMDTDMLKDSPRTFWVVSPEQAANDIWMALKARKQTIYTLSRWGLVMWIIKHIPSVIFRRLSF
ncbi:MAG: SDR family NAD(P)-dependent oxidoreductase [Chloroflexi bacterium]|nr:SDR family NAD(P)-dependent oxidoreductase [Chloroflexota bacterium]